MPNKIKIITLLLLAFRAEIYAQPAPFHIAIEPISISGLGGLQSFAWAQHEGKWLLIGGRLDGLHRRQPFAAFDVAGNNNQLIVVDPVAKQKWSAPLSSLPTGLQEQLSATNMEFIQDGEYLYLAGGYGYSKTSSDHITYPNLSAVKVADVIKSVINGTSFTSYFRQISDTLFAVTGGSLNKINSTFHLTGGHKFMGRYNPMGPDHGPGFTQEYTNAIRKFTISDNGAALVVSHLPAIIDNKNLHRRDFNVVQQIMPQGQEGLTAFSGVFRVGADLPYLNCINIDSTGHEANTAFTQYYNHYHCAHIPLYSAASKEMHTVFFGGIAQYFDSLGVLVQDNNVPFVKTIARVTRDANGVMAEYKLPVEMPSLLGAGSEFIPLENLPKYSNDVIKLDELMADKTLVGYIYGGISSKAANIFWTNTGLESSASNQLFNVYVIKNSTVGTHELNTQSIGTLQMEVYPNPNSGDFIVRFKLKNKSEVKLSIFDESGKLLENTILQNAQAGFNSYTQRIKNLTNSGIYHVTIETTNEKASQKIIVDL